MTSVGDLAAGLEPAAERHPAGKPLRLTHVTHWTLPKQETATIQLVQTLSALAELGVVVELLSPRRLWSRPRAPEQLRQALSAYYGAPCRFRARELPSRIPGLAGVSRLMHAGLAALGSNSGGADAVHTRDLEAAWLCLKAGRRVVFETYRLWTRRSAFHRNRLLRLAAQRGFLGIVLHSRYAADCYIADGVPAEKTRAIHNGFDPGPFALARTPPEARRALGFPEAPTVVFLGVIAAHKRIDLLLDAAGQTPEIRWILAGDSSLSEALPLVERARALPNVSFPGYVTGDRLASVLQAGDVLIIPPSADPLQRSGRTVMPLKVFQYLAAGRPILTGEVPDTAELLVQDRNCVRIPPDDLPALLENLRALFRDPARRERLGSAARRDAAALTWAARGEAFLAFLRERLGADR